ncbi:antitermination protein Q [Providencia rettgeri]|uniref:antiterminator Q family protein n=1 Tax=Providencia rettgeri TaxID=587 RepID=UPI0014197372|nr:antiterminator Q family protein [Providencia rettgeri]NIA73967.1 antitermination protein Q [Providencia rettgeri]NIA79833.1 antitermination protein Q [Providencia rettgeri]NIB03053.1 antitermination protein Q [Providencia rettgeri]NIB07220.1 antitermination protein Q [Providencia rettgeri]NIB20745.1 antitermination protein Q [Providencia rettgeri]
MRDIQLVLSKWAGWASDNPGVDYSNIAAGFKGLIANKEPSRESCSDDDGITIDSVIAKLRQVRKEEELELIVLHYLYGVSKRSIAKEWKVSEGRIRQMMQVAEGFVDGCLAMLGVALEMDEEVINKVRDVDSKKVLVRYANSMLL